MNTGRWLRKQAPQFSFSRRFITLLVSACLAAEPTVGREVSFVKREVPTNHEALSVKRDEPKGSLHKEFFTAVFGEQTLAIRAASFANTSNRDPAVWLRQNATTLAVASAGAGTFWLRFGPLAKSVPFEMTGLLSIALHIAMWAVAVAMVWYMTGSHHPAFLPADGPPGEPLLFPPLEATAIYAAFQSGRLRPYRQAYPDLDWGLLETKLREANRLNPRAPETWTLESWPTTLPSSTHNGRFWTKKEIREAIEKNPYGQTRGGNELNPWSQTLLGTSQRIIESLSWAPRQKQLADRLDVVWGNVQAIYLRHGTIADPSIPPGASPLTGDIDLLVVVKGDRSERRLINIDAKTAGLPLPVHVQVIDEALFIAGHEEQALQEKVDAFDALPLYGVDYLKRTTLDGSNRFVFVDSLLAKAFEISKAISSPKLAYGDNIQRYPVAVFEALTERLGRQMQHRLDRAAGFFHSVVPGNAMRAWAARSIRDISYFREGMHLLHDGTFRWQRQRSLNIITEFLGVSRSLLAERTPALQNPKKSENFSKRTHLTFVLTSWASVILLLAVAVSVAAGWWNMGHTLSVGARIAFSAISAILALILLPFASTGTTDLRRLCFGSTLQLEATTNKKLTSWTWKINKDGEWLVSELRPGIFRTHAAPIVTVLVDSLNLAQLASLERVVQEEKRHAAGQPELIAKLGAIASLFIRDDADLKRRRRLLVEGILDSIKDNKDPSMPGGSGGQRIGEHRRDSPPSPRAMLLGAA